MTTVKITQTDEGLLVERVGDNENVNENENDNDNDNKSEEEAT